MSQNPLIDSGTQSSKAPGLKPALASALASLEVQLDQELSRYRRTRHGSRKPSSVSAKTFISNQQQKSHGTGATLNTTQPATHTDTTTETSLALTLVKKEQLNYTQIAAPKDSVKKKTPPPPPPNPVINTPPQANSSSIVHTKANATGNENLVQKEETSTPPDDYLESSEALLRSLAEEQTAEQPTPSTSSSEGLLSPLGIGSMLLLLLASLTLGYVVFNPQTLPHLYLGKIFSGTNTANEENAESTGNSQPVAAPELTPIPKYPNLAANEFPEVRDPNDVVNLKPKVQPTTTTAPAASIPTPSNPVVVPNSSPTIPPEPQVRTTENPAPIGEIKPSADGFYYVVTENQSAGALSAAREVVPDAYLSADQKYIYLGALRTPEQVQRRLQQLQARGIKARVQ
ncbi:MAG TPA: hypothetical protein VK203_11980 [Nostocaceae cyanobacterium]|nr:hypothetical protein [Nostocaceae cyanobacterium]